jgi:class 3 adenylate cyclase/predicted ATPase
MVVAVACAQCGFKYSPQHRYCAGCGAPLAGGQQHDGELPEPTAAPDLAPTEMPERRHLTVMFCDLVGSTALSEQLDPEELNDLILAYREAAAAAIVRFDGHVARYVGDGILAYFGYPRAHGDDPVRAVHAGLEIIAGVRDLASSLEVAKAVNPQVRIGVHTGLVVVGDLARGAVREKDGVVGETPNLAARLIALAEPDSIFISGVTHALVRNHFECRELGPTPVKGLSRPVNVYQVIRARNPDSVAYAGETTGFTVFTGREGELALLRDRWSKVLEGKGQVVSIVGEPGIGKSRLVRAFTGGLAGTDHFVRVLHCSPHFSNTALFPIIEYLRRWLDRMGDDKLRQLENAVGEAGMSATEVVPIIASLLALPLAPSYQAPQASAKVQRDLVMEFLLNSTTRQAANRPLVLVIEDLHWSDPSTLELVRLLLNQIDTARILLLLTFRTDFHPPWPLHSYLTHLALDRLTATEAREMLERVVGDKRLPAFVSAQLVEKTDGVPLFVEELTKAVIESGALVEAGDDYQLRAPSIDIDIPISLHATLMSRLDSLDSAKLVAQCAAVIGRDFSYDLINATAALPAGELDHGLAQLVEAKLLFQRGVPPRARYAFKHSLIQEAAYQSMLRANRAKYHRRIAEALTAQFPNMPQMPPELVAHHYSAARQPMEAAAYWRKAGEQALARSAIVEALAHVNKGLAELTTCPKSPQRAKEEVLLLIALGVALTASKGYAAPEVEQAYARARDLCGEVGDPTHLFQVLRGLQSFYVVRGPLRIAGEMAEQLRQMAVQTGDPLRRLEAHRRLGWCLFCMGEIDAGRNYLGKALQEYDRGQSAQHILAYGSDPAIIGTVNLAWLEWFGGRSDQAIRYSQQSIALARELSYGLGLAYALGMSAALYQCLGDAETTARLAEETIGLARKYGFPYWVAWETSLLGWTRTVDGQTDAGVEMLQQGLAAYRATGAELFSPYMLGLLAEAHLRARRFDRAIALCQEALACGERTDVHFFDAEIHRIKGECLVNQADERALTCFEQAAAVAGEQGARTLEIRAVTALASLQRSRGRADVAHRILADAVQALGETVVSSDLDQARRLLQEWNAR